MHVLQLLVWLLPASRSKNALLRRLGHDVHPTARVAPNLVWHVKRVVLARGSQVASSNVFKHLNLVSVGVNSTIGRYNLFSSHPAFAYVDPQSAQLVVGDEGFITTLHHLDVSGSFHLGDFSALAGHQTRVMTHSIDLSADVQAAQPIRVGERSFVGARCLLLGGSSLPARSVLAAGSTLIDAQVEPAGLYTGSPARFKKELSGAWFERESGTTSRIRDPATGSIVEF